METRTFLSITTKDTSTIMHNSSLHIYSGKGLRLIVLVSSVVMLRETLVSMTLLGYGI